MPKNNLYHTVFNSPEIKTVQDYLNDLSSPATVYSNDPNRFLNIIGYDNLTNRQRIELTYKIPSQKKLVGKNLAANQLPLNTGTPIYLEIERVNDLSAFVTEGIETVSTDEVAFKSAMLAQLEADRGYVSVIKPIQGKLSNGLLNTSTPNCTVWMWVRSLSPNQVGKDEELQGELIDISPFIISCNTKMAKRGGTFSITVPPLVCELDENDKWIIKKKSIIEGEEYLSETSMFDEQFERNNFYFNNAIKSNDIIFIRYESLEMEKNQRYSDSQNYYVNKSNIAGRNYDFIGLVSNTIQTINPASNDVVINIQGSSLSKLFTDDCTYVFPLEMSEGITKVAGDTHLKNSLIGRNYADGGILFLGLYLFNSIEYVIKFVMQQITNIKVAPDSLFVSYGDRVNTHYVEVNNKNQNVKGKNYSYKERFKKEPANGIWKIVKLLLDESTASRRVVDSSLSTMQGSIMNFFTSVCQDPFVEIYSDTYFDMYHLIVRQPPYTQKAIVSLIEGKVNTESNVKSNPAIVNVEPGDVIHESLAMNDEEVYSWYHLIPRAAIINTQYNYSTSVLPAIFFDEFAQVYGNKPLQVVSNYIPYMPVNSSSDDLNIIERQAFLDLQYLIQSNQYLPFSRKGTLTLSGDRRIKIGNIIRYLPTHEIYFVNAVQQSFNISENSIERVTIVSIDRGLKEQLIYGVPYLSKTGKTIYASYFNIINTNLDFTEREVDVPYTEVIKKKDDLSAINDIEIEQKTGNVGLYYLELYRPYPENRKLFIKLINAINKYGYNVILISGSTNRSYFEQLTLKNNNPLNALAGTSKHEKGQAIDITIVSKTSGKIYSKSNSTKEEWLSTGVIDLAKALGFNWGGEIFSTYPDLVHFEIAGANERVVEAEKYVTKYKKVKRIDTEGAFKNFRVNKEVFSFFLKNLQFSEEYNDVKSRVIYDVDGTVKNIKYN